MQHQTTRRNYLAEDCDELDRRRAGGWMWWTDDDGVMWIRLPCGHQFLREVIRPLGLVCPTCRGASNVH